jgi:hypothetical protein
MTVASSHHFETILVNKLLFLDCNSLEYRVAHLFLIQLKNLRSYRWDGQDFDLTNEKHRAVYHQSMAQIFALSGYENHGQLASIEFAELRAAI